MGIWDAISWSTDSVKSLWQSSYDQGCAAMTKMNKVVRVDEAVEKANQQLSDPETRSKISRVGTNVAKNAAIEGLKAIPGAFPAYKIVAKSLSDENESNNENKSKKYEEDLKTLQATVSRLETEVRFLREQAAETQNQSVKMKPENTVQSHQEKEDNNRVSGTKNSIRSHL